MFTSAAILELTHRSVVLVEGDAEEAAALAVLLLLSLLPDAAAAATSMALSDGGRGRRWDQLQTKELSLGPRCIIVAESKRRKVGPTNSLLKLTFRRSHFKS